MILSDGKLIDVNYQSSVVTIRGLSLSDERRNFWYGLHLGCVDFKVDFDIGKEIVKLPKLSRLICNILMKWLSYILY